MKRRKETTETRINKDNNQIKAYRKGKKERKIEKRKITNQDTCSFLVSVGISSLRSYCLFTVTCTALQTDRQTDRRGYCDNRGL
jgi:hypothetical protein